MSQPRYPWETVEAETHSYYNHLLTPAAEARYVLAAHYLRDCPHLVEIGGFKTPITKFVEPGAHRSITVLDPKMEAFEADELYGAPCRVRHLRAVFQAHRDWPAAGSYGLTILGLSIKHFSDDPKAEAAEWSHLVALIDGAAVSVIEYPVEWDLAAQEVERILAATRTRARLSIDMDMTRNPGFEDAHRLRRFMVLDPEAVP